MVPKTSKKPKAPKEPKTGPHHRAAKLDNARDLVCPVCWTAPPTIRKDGVTLPRHGQPSDPAKHCDGQGRIARYVVDDPWEIGTEPKTHISALEFIQHGTKRIDERAAEAEAKAKRAEERAKRAQEAKAAKATKPKAEPKPKAPKASKPKAAKPRSRKPKPKAKADENGSTGSPETAVTEPPAVV